MSTDSAANNQYSLTGLTKGIPLIIISVNQTLLLRKELLPRLKEKLIGELTVHSFKVDKEQLNLAKRFFNRQGAPLQHGMRDLIGVAAGCEKCLKLHEENASLSELQSAFATLLTNCKAAQYLGSFLQDVIIKTAKVCNLPIDFITNFLGEAQRIKPALRRT
jgi:hypothetical protein